MAHRVKELLTFLVRKKKDAVDFIILLIIAFTIILMSCLLLEYIM